MLFVMKRVGWDDCDDVDEGALNVHSRRSYRLLKVGSQLILDDLVLVQPKYNTKTKTNHRSLTDCSNANNLLHEIWHESPLAARWL